MAKTVAGTMYKFQFMAKTAARTMYRDGDEDQDVEGHAGVDNGTYTCRECEFELTYGLNRIHQQDQMSSQVPYPLYNCFINTARQGNTTLGERMFHIRGGAKLNKSGI